MFNTKRKKNRNVKNSNPGHISSGIASLRLLIMLIFTAFAAGMIIHSSKPITFFDIAFRLIFPLLIGLSIISSLRICNEWERAVILRLGKFKSVKGPGFFFIIPLIDRIADFVDMRIRVSDFTAETTLTTDSVTVTVDALCFWMVWDAEKAICEVQDYEDAVVLSSKTALRNAVSSHILTDFLAQNSKIEECIRKSVDSKTTDWGITIQNIEITDIQIPHELQQSLSRMAEGERERNARILIAEAETEIAEIYKKSAGIYDTSPTALTLKNLSIINEGLKAGNSMMLVPNSITEKINSDGVLAIQAIQKSTITENELKDIESKISDNE
ncbi:MAG: hypothetical protein JXK07_03720 [Spirochaetes bacterium]|nr:hypothetical protein [Spirochaetota bacterium]MBN2769396.1 hypothetical protein [Spirochaetota bacterium]